MLIAQMSGIKKFYNDRLILKVNDFKIYKRDRIGIVGMNGAGKTTFLNILTNKIVADEGKSTIYGTYGYITQFGNEEEAEMDGYIASKFGTSDLQDESLSGGEITRLKIAKALSSNNVLIIGYEPTSNLDREGIELLQTELIRFDGAILIVSHDREFLDAICNEILEIENGEIKLYKGNYSAYQALKKSEWQREAFEYKQYISEKSRLQEAAEQKKNKARTMKKVPNRMGNSEARLHKMGNQGAKAKLDGQVNAIKTRIEKMDVKEKPKELPKIKIDIKNSKVLYCNTVVSSEGLNKNFGNKVIFNDAQFKIFNNSKTAIIGQNGSGKTTLIKMIVNGDPAINKAKGVKMGYFSQDMNVLIGNKTLLQNVMESSMYDETFVRILLSRLLFKQEDLAKNVYMLSGGEKVKAALAKIIISDFNMLILDEPTNYLDIYTMEAVEEAISKYKGTVVFVSHDRRFINNIADHIISIENKKTICFDGNYEEYIREKNETLRPNNKSANKMLLQHRMAEILGKLSMPSKYDDINALDAEYQQILKELKQL